MSKLGRNPTSEELDTLVDLMGVSRSEVEKFMNSFKKSMQYSTPVTAEKAANAFNDILSKKNNHGN